MAVVMSLLYSISNLKYIQNPSNFVFQFRYLIILGGALVLGYVISMGQSSQSKIFRAALYAALAMSFYWFLDASTQLMRNPMGLLPQTWENYLPAMLPMSAIIATGIIAILSLLKQHTITLGKIMLIATFIITQLYFLITQIVLYRQDFASLNSPWPALFEIIASPLLISIVGYFLFVKLGNKFERIFYSVLVGVVFGIMVELTWGLLASSSLNLTGEVRLIIIFVWMFCFCGKHDLQLDNQIM